MANRIQVDQFAIVKDLLKRQDLALEQLDALDAQVDQAIEEMMGTRERQPNPAGPNSPTF